MRDFLTLDSTPFEETCIPAGKNPEMEKRECRIFMEQCYRTLEKEFGEELSCRLKVVGQPHDSGVYYEVHVIFNDDNEKGVNQAYWLEANIPERWDDEAKEALKALKALKS